MKNHIRKNRQQDSDFILFRSLYKNVELVGFKTIRYVYQHSISQYGLN